MRNNDLIIGLYNSLISSNDFSSLEFEMFKSLQDVDRWMLLKYILLHKSIRPIHFLHIPKTGGTTLGTSLGKDGKALVIHVDCSPKDYLNQLKRLIALEGKKPVITRAHHSLSTLKEADVISCFRVMFTVYRDPIKAHVSNVNMIMRRLKSFALNEAMPENVMHFCTVWHGVLQRPFQYSVEYAKYIISSKEYFNQVGNLYSSYLDLKSLIEFVNDRKLLIFDCHNFDDIYTEVFDYSKPPERLNVSEEPLLRVDDVSENTYKILITRDIELVSFISNNIMKPSQLRSYLT
ncbi:hypothetical protein [Vibrio rotiferianus]|uniref:hypothetical protein n=1 Tax=Vibrio rotiferianus TaxID=190895 RepID=UPI002895CC0C|nr:conserved hypothetical protein [Vibrio rotiferianus]